MKKIFAEDRGRTVLPEIYARGQTDTQTGTLITITPPPLPEEE